MKFLTPLLGLVSACLIGADLMAEDNKPALGISVNLEGERPQVLVIFEKGTGDQMGMEVGDHLLAWSTAAGESESPTWTEITNMPDIREMLGSLKIGDSFSLKVQRAQEEVVLSGKALAPVPSPNPKAGIYGEDAPEWNCPQWEGDPEKPYKLSDYTGKAVVMYCFQSWCPGCHSVGFPTMQKVEELFKDDDRVACVYVQTVFEGFHTNTFEKGKKVVREKFNLTGPYMFDDRKSAERIMTTYRSRGTPWLVVIGPDGKVLFNAFHAEGESIDDKAAFVKDLIEQAFKDQ